MIIPVPLFTEKRNLLLNFEIELKLNLLFNFLGGFNTEHFLKEWVPDL